jgi:hypothetical protein
VTIRKATGELAPGEKQIEELAIAPLLGTHMLAESPSPGRRRARIDQYLSEWVWMRRAQVVPLTGDASGPPSTSGSSCATNRRSARGPSGPIEFAGAAVRQRLRTD